MDEDKHIEAHIMALRVMKEDPNGKPLFDKYRKPTILEMISDLLHRGWPRRRFVSKGFLTHMSDKDPLWKMRWADHE